MEALNVLLLVFILAALYQTSILKYVKNMGV